MRPQEKKLLLDNLIDLRRRLVWAAQSQDENLQAYSGRVQRTYEVYIKAGEIANKEIIEVRESNYEKERLAIFCYINPLKTRQNRAEISRNELCHPLHNQKKKYPCFFFCRLQLLITNYLNK